MSTQEQNTPHDTDSDPRHHIIPDEGWEWEKPLTNKELFDENARLRKKLREMMEILASCKTLCSTETVQRHYGASAYWILNAINKIQGKDD